MCKLDVILKTNVSNYAGKPTAKRGMTMDRIRFNTDVMFALARRLELPLDCTTELMRRSGGFKRLYNSYMHRHDMTTSEIAKELSRSLN